MFGKWRKKADPCKKSKATLQMELNLAEARLITCQGYRDQYRDGWEELEGHASAVASQLAEMKAERDSHGKALQSMKAQLAEVTAERDALVLMAQDVDEYLGDGLRGLKRARSMVEAALGAKDAPHTHTFVPQELDGCAGEPGEPMATEACECGEVRDVEEACAHDWHVTAMAFESPLSVWTCKKCEAEETRDQRNKKEATDEAR